MKKSLGFKRIILFARTDRENPGVDETLERLTAFLTVNNIKHVRFSPELILDGKNDLMVVVGGDGSLLSCAQYAVEESIPVIGINRGRLGFLTDIPANNFEDILQQVIQGKYVEEYRFLLSLKLYNNTQVLHVEDALNDIVLSRGELMHLVMFDLHIDKQVVGHYRSDGLILSTPTGSTAYALSAGGPILHPEINAIGIVPMFSHSLSSRPLVVDGNSIIDVIVDSKNENPLQVSCDGRNSVTVAPGFRLNIQQKKQKLRLLHPIAYHYYDTLRIKLGWGGTNANIINY